MAVTDLPFIDTFLSVGRGLAEVEPPELQFDSAQSVLDPWSSSWFLGRSVRATQTAETGRMFAPTDDDPGHAQADERATAAGRDLSTADLLSIARSQIGAPYIWADSNPVGAVGGEGSGFDCSGFTQWVLSRFGVTTQHMASLQQQQFQSVSRQQLRPGDLVFMNYGRKAAGVADHVGLYIGNGQMIAASSSAGQVTEQAVDWEHFIGGGATGIESTSGMAPTRGRGRGQAAAATTAAAPDQPFTLINAGLTGGGSSLPGIMASLLQSPTAPELPPRANAEAMRGGTGSVKGQLYQGFLDAGRPDLARMVYTRDFDAWIRAESGWRVDAVSQYFEGHGRNYGIFQFAQVHPWTANFLTNGEWTASAYQQAQLVARYFPSLTADAIRGYAEQVRNGNYSGWG